MSKYGNSFADLRQISRDTRHREPTVTMGAANLLLSLTLALNTSLILEAKVKKVQDVLFRESPAR